MDRHARKNLKKEVITAASSAAIIVLFSVSIWILPPLGNLFNPNGDFWDSTKGPHDHPPYEVVTVPSLSGENVTVYRDSFGVPHIYASHREDLFYAYGYCMAQDRFFEMTLLKMVGWGRTAEVIGSLGVSIDKYLRTISLWKSAEDLIEVAEANQATYPQAFAVLESYTKGVNAWIKTHKRDLPLEFSLLDLPVESWEMVDTALMANLAGLMLSWVTTDLAMEELRLKLGPYLEANETIYGTDALSNLFPTWDMEYPYEMPILPDNHSIFPAAAGSSGSPSSPQSAFLMTLQALQRLDSNALGFLTLGTDGDWVGSNNWVINGSLSPTGKPILCGDPHLVYMTPSVWYEVHLVCDDSGYTSFTDPKTGSSYSYPNGYNVYGVGFPGTPIVLIGHNEHCAWSETNVGSDSFVDYYYETLNEAKTQYLFNGEWEDVTVKNWPIRVKNGEFFTEEPFQIRYTRHGPLLTGSLLGSSEIADVAADYGMTSFTPEDISVKYIGYNVSVEYNQLVAFDLLNRAQNVTGIKFALDQYPNPPQNFVVADDLGNIGMICAGLYPVRAKNGVVSASYSGRFIQPGNGTGEEWVGFVPPEHLPFCINPVNQSYLASANQRTIAAEIYNYSIGHQWAENYRARSINRYLNTSDPASPYYGKQISFEDLQNIQYSSYDVAAEVYVPLLLDTYDALSAEKKATYSPEVRAAIAELRAWNNSDQYRYEMQTHLRAPTIFDKWMKLLPGNVWGDEWAAAGMSGVYPSTQILEEIMRTGANTNPWFDNITTKGVQETRTDIVLSTLVEAIGTLVEKHGSLVADPNAWIWGNHHVLATIGIPLLFNVLTGRRVDTYPIPGSSRTLNNGPTLDLKLDLGPIHADLSDLVPAGPSWRQVVDLSAPERSVGIYPGGQSEDIASKHYFDQAPLWAAGNYKNLLFFSSPQEFVQTEIESVLIFRRS